MATCKECVMGALIYVPCGKPENKIIGWKGRSDPPLPMCDHCADHNVKNRGGYVVAEKITEEFD